MKTTALLPVSLLLVLGLVACSTAESRWRAADLRTRNEFLVQQYMLDCVAAGQTFPLFHLGVKNIQEYFAKYPDLQDAREEFEAADNGLLAVLMKDSQYRENHAWYYSLPPNERHLDEWKQRNGEVYQRLQQTNPEYVLARDKRDRALYRSNMLTLERILRDARADDRILPVEWIGRDRIADYVRRF